MEKTKGLAEYLEAREALKLADKIGVTEEIWEALLDTEVQTWEALSEEEQGEEMVNKIGVTEEIWEELLDMEVQAWMDYGGMKMKAVKELNEGN